MKTAETNYRPGLWQRTAVCFFSLLLTTAYHLVAQNVLDRVEFTQGIQQLQTIAALQASLAAGGQPPVSLVANRKGVLRLYPIAGSGAVEVTVTFPGGRQVMADRAYAAGCTTDVQRVWTDPKAACRSFDIDFTPPQTAPPANWTVMVTAVTKTKRDQLMFTFTNIPLQRELEIRASSVCSQKFTIPFFTTLWLNCGDPGTPGLFSYAGIFPTHQTPRSSRQTVRVDRSAFAPPDDTEHFYNEVLFQLAVIHVFDNIADIINPPPLVRRPVYMGVVSGTTNVAYSGQADINSSRATVVDTFDFLGNPNAANWISSHEIGHALNLFHTNTGLPAAAGAGVQNGCQLAADPGALAAAQWPYANNRIQSGPAGGPAREVGFDLRADHAYPAVFSVAGAGGNDIYEIMGYCQPQWISPIKYNVALASLAPGAPIPLLPQSDPSGNQSPAPVSPGYWQVAGQIVNGQATLHPLFTFPDGGNSNAGTGAYQIQVLDGMGNVLFRRNFDLDVTEPENPGDNSAPVSQTFFQLIPKQNGAGKITVVDANNNILATIALTGPAPVVRVNAPTNGQNVSGLTPVSWAFGEVTSPCSIPSPLTSRVQYSADGGNTWYFLGDVTDTSMGVDFDQLPGSVSSNSSQIQVSVSDGCHVGTATSSSFTVTHKLPTNPQITGVMPYHAPYDLVGLEGTAYDGDDGQLFGDSISWGSNLDGSLGTGSLLNAALSPGNQSVTMTATDSNGNQVSTTTTLSVAQGPPGLDVSVYPDPSNPNCTDVTLTAQADPYVPLYGAEYSLDGQSLSFVPASNLPFTYVVHSVGTFDFLAAALDVVGQQNVMTVTVTTHPGCD